jgi:hypothetical protein
MNTTLSVSKQIKLLDAALAKETDPQIAEAIFIAGQRLRYGHDVVNQPEN